MVLTGEDRGAAFLALIDNAVEVKQDEHKNKSKS